MVRVPTYNENQVGISNVPQQSIDVSVKPQAFGDYSWTEKGADALDIAHKVLLKKQAEDDKIKLAEKESALDQYRLDTLLGENGLLKKTGNQAMGQMTKLMEDFKKKTSELSADLSPELQQEFLLKASDKERDFYQTGMSHEIRETQVHKNAQMQTSANQQIQFAVLNRNNPEKVETYKKAMHDTIFTNASDSAQAEGLYFSKVSEMNVSILSTMLSENNPNAKAYFEKNKSEIDASLHDNIINQINVNDIKAKSQFEADRIRSLGLSFDKQLMEVRKIKDPELRDATQTRVEHDYALSEKIKADREENLINAGWENVVNNPNLNSIPSNVDALTRVKMADYIKQVTTQGEIKTNQATWYELYNLATTNPDEFKKVNLMDYKNALSDSDFQEIAKLKGKVGSAEYTQLITPHEEVMNAAKALGLKKGSDKETRFEYIVQNALQSEEQALGRKLNQKERTDFINSFGLKINHPGWDYDTTYKAYERGMNDHNDFVRATINDIKYFEKVHNRLPDAKERNDIIYSRAASVIRKQNLSTVEGINVSATPQLQSYASYLPQLNNKLGTNFQITSGYRAGDKGTHGKGNAVDIGMNGKGINAKVAFFKSELNNPQVKKIGTSDEFILSVFKGHPKLEDERNYDKKNGTNHKNHAHVTLEQSKLANNEGWAF